MSKAYLSIRVGHLSDAIEVRNYFHTNKRTAHIEGPRYNFYYVKARAEREYVENLIQWAKQHEVYIFGIYTSLWRYE